MEKKGYVVHLSFDPGTFTSSSFLIVGPNAQ